jgi:uncharacterized protein YjgD (DUF1641 family)
LSQGIDGIDSAMTASTVTTASGLLDLALNAVAVALVSKIAANQLWQSKLRETF